MLDLDVAPRSTDAAVHGPRRCRGCGGHEIFRLTCRVDDSWLDLELCARCDPSHPLLVAIERLVVEVFSE